MNRTNGLVLAWIVTLLLGCASVTPVVNADMMQAEESKMTMKADRLPPEEVEPVVVGQVKYEVIHWGKNHGLEQNGGYISATNTATKKEIWVLKIYTPEYDSKMEEDVQDVFITSMSKAWFKNKLNIVNEDNEEYQVDLDTREVTQTK